ncbi:malonate decarboxylase holo-ACP synthase [Tunturibacter psychrotolerans]|uniref:Malonate decarboxylase holo-ACP synthase n=1 Tax=Tunturiibacter psychrotolerans TaxID=3069686 RepID=A0AAU7ZK49_9BACT
MLPTDQYSPRIHDLLLLRAGIVSSAGVAKPAWVSYSPASNLWVVVRRAIAPDGLVAVGIRGINRQQRWGGFADVADVKERLRPSQLSLHMASRTRIVLPALAALVWLEEQLDKSELDWGPVGSVGFELATGQQVVTATSDLDLVLFTPTRFTRDTARDLWSFMSAAPSKVDVRVETPYCGFSLEEYAREGTEQVLVRLPASRILAEDPWAISVSEDKE